MKENKIKKYKEKSKTGFLLLRQKLGFSRYIKTTPRDSQKKELLINLALKIIQEREKNDYVLLGPKYRKVNIS